MRRAGGVIGSMPHHEHRKRFIMVRGCETCDRLGAKLRPTPVPHKEQLHVTHGNAGRAKRKEGQKRG